MTLSGEPSGVTCSGTLEVQFYVKKKDVDTSYTRLLNTDYSINGQDIFSANVGSYIQKKESTELNEIGVYYFEYKVTVTFSDGTIRISRSTHYEDIFTYTVLSPCTAGKITVDRVSATSFMNKDYTLGDPSDSQSYSISSLFALSGEPSGITCSTTLGFVTFYIRRDETDNNYVRLLDTPYLGTVFNLSSVNQELSIVKITDP